MHQISKIHKLDPNKIMVTRAVKTDEEAVSAKMRALNPKLFGLFNPVPYDLLSRKKVYIPYECMVFSYRIRSGRKRNSDEIGRFDKTGEIGVIFDFNEVHGFHYDLNDDLDLWSVARDDADGEILPDQCSSQTALQEATSLIRFKFLHRPFHQVDITLISRQKFYRIAWDLTVLARDKELSRYAYLDLFGSYNEHVSGLKIRQNI